MLIEPLSAVKSHNVKALLFFVSLVFIPTLRGVMMIKKGETSSFLCDFCMCKESHVRVCFWGKIFGQSEAERLMRTC